MGENKELSTDIQTDIQNGLRSSESHTVRVASSLVPAS